MHLISNWEREMLVYYNFTSTRASTVDWWALTHLVVLKSTTTRSNDRHEFIDQSIVDLIDFARDFDYVEILISYVRWELLVNEVFDWNIFSKYERDVQVSRRKRLIDSWATNLSRATHLRKTSDFANSDKRFQISKSSAANRTQLAICSLVQQHS